MSDDELVPTGHVSLGRKTTAEYANLDAEDESLARWKASLGIRAESGIGGEYDENKPFVVSFFITSSTRPGGDLHASLDTIAHTPIAIKEGEEYSVGLVLNSPNRLASGLRYIQVTKSRGVQVDKMEEIIRTYPKVTFPKEEAPSGLLARAGTFDVRSRVVDNDGNVKADFSWKLSITKDW